MKRYRDHVKARKIDHQWYHVFELIGKGGFSEVYHCVSFKDRKSYALKQTSLEKMDEENVKLLINEIDVMKKLKSQPGCIQIYDHELDRVKQKLYIVMELGSTDLSQIFKAEIQKHGCVPEPARSFWWRKMLEAVAAIHRVGIIHSDIKPGNFVVCSGAEVKLIDFNISNTMNERTSITLNMDCGTLSYMAPESIQQTGKRINQKVDVWGLGTILYLITYGRLPYAHLKKNVQVMYAICDKSRHELKFAPVDGQDDLVDCIDVSYFIPYFIPI